jgi:hypothetical protein
VSQTGSLTSSKSLTVDGNDSLWLTVIGSGRQLLAVVGSCWQLLAVIGNVRDHLSLFARYLSDFMLPWLVSVNI